MIQAEPLLAQAQGLPGVLFCERVVPERKLTSDHAG
jgi:hypothetical protein